MTYYIRARLLPTVLTAIPWGVLAYLILSPSFSRLEEIWNLLPEAAVAAFLAGLIYLSTQVTRVISIKIFQPNELFFPSTTQLLWVDDTLDVRTKTQIRKKIESLFGTELPTVDEERQNEFLARKQLKTVGSQLRNSLRDNPILLQHNIEYGFIRNFLGGCVVAVAVSLFLLFWGMYNNFTWVQTFSLVSSLAYFIPILLNKPLLNWYSKRYTKVLLEQFLSLNT